MEITLTDLRNRLDYYCNQYVLCESDLATLKALAVITDSLNQGYVAEDLKRIENNAHISFIFFVQDLLNLIVATAEKIVNEDEEHERK